MNYREILDQIECSLALLEPPAFSVKPTNLSFKNGWFSGLWVKYQGVDVFIPHNELKAPYHLCSAAEDLVKSGATIKVYPLRIDINKNSRDPSKWQVPICTMFSPDDRATAATEAEEINIKKGEVVEWEDFNLEIVEVEYHQREDEKRPKTVVLRITAPSKYPIIRPEQESDDFRKWEELSEHSNRRSSLRIRRFFYKKKGKNTVKIGDVKITLLPFFSQSERKKMQQLGYIGKLRIRRGNK